MKTRWRKERKKREKTEKEKEEGRKGQIEWTRRQTDIDR